ncbi:serine hydrolase [Ochrobactrum cytisi]|nr:serine hydrolase [Brucella cytisi]
MKAGFGVAACIYNATLRSCDHGPFLQSPWYGHQADKPIYPASVIKLFFLDALAAFRENGMIAEDEEDDRAAAQMMAISSNEATVYLVGRLTGADDGACLQGTALEDWCAARHRVQQWYDSQNRMEFASINVLHGTYEDSPYGRAKQIRNGQNGNLLTPLSGAALLHDIARDARPRSKWMMGLMNREFQRHPNDAEPEGDQVRGFLVGGLPPEVMTGRKVGIRPGPDMIWFMGRRRMAKVLSCSLCATASGRQTTKPSFPYSRSAFTNMRFKAKQR